MMSLSARSQVSCCYGNQDANIILHTYVEVLLFIHVLRHDMWGVCLAGGADILSALMLTSLLPAGSGLARVSKLHQANVSDPLFAGFQVLLISSVSMLESNSDLVFCLSFEAANVSLITEETNAASKLSISRGTLADRRHRGVKLQLRSCDPRTRRRLFFFSHITQVAISSVSKTCLA